MKKSWMILLAALLCSAPAFATEVEVDLRIPDVNVGGLSGEERVVALWVEDSRKNTVLGKDQDGASVVLGQDAASTVMATVATTLRASDFRIEPYHVDAPLAMLVRLQTITYSVEKGMVSSKARVSATLRATVSHGGKQAIEKSFTTSGEYTIAWRPTKAKLGKVVGDTLADAVRALLQDTDIASALSSDVKESQPAAAE